MWYPERSHRGAVGGLEYGREARQRVDQGGEAASEPEVRFVFDHVSEKQRGDPSQRRVHRIYTPMVNTQV